MNVGRTLLAIVGLVALALAYRTGNYLYLFLALVVFFIGLYVMGAMRRSAGTTSKDEASKQKNRKQN